MPPIIIPRFHPTAMSCVTALVFWATAGHLPSLLAQDLHLTPPTVRSNFISFSFRSSLDQLLTVQSSSALALDWVDVADLPGTGSVIEFQAPLSPGRRLFRLKITEIVPTVEILPRELTLKAGESVNLQLTATGTKGALTWSATGLPAGLSLSSAGVLTGQPTALAAERNEDGHHDARIDVSEFLSDPAGFRQTTILLPIAVRLSYALNIRATRPGGPSLQLLCAVCHGPDFKPDIQGTARQLIFVKSGSGAECGTDRDYISPGDASDSLLFEKVSPRANCGERMPFDGPYLTDQQLDRLARWIRELEADDID